MAVTTYTVKRGDTLSKICSTYKSSIAGTTNWDRILTVSKLISSDMDTQPTIHPVVDLSDVESSVGAMSNMLNMNPSVGIMSNISAISSTMNSRQNGASDVVSAIKDIGKKLGSSSGDTYNINGITYDDGSNVSNAVKTLVRAARIERSGAPGAFSAH